ncbi:hypothetical protein V8F06_008713 [Rhypophila decipiens]
MAPTRRRLWLSSLPLLFHFTTAQSFVGGDLNAQAPFSLPPDRFSSLTSNPSSDNTFTITGYDLSQSASSSDATGKTVKGWSLAVHLTNDVPLTHSTDNTVPKDQFFQATRMSLIPPDGGFAEFNENDWMVCGIVFTGGVNNQDDGEVADNGSCGNYLGDACIQAIQVAGVTARNQSAGTIVPGQGAGRCQDLELPTACVNDGGFSSHGGGSAFEIVPVTDSETNTGRMSFFAAGSAPVKNKDDTDSIKAAQDFVWPILLTWTHFGEGSNGTASTVHDSAGWLSCVQAPNTTSQAVDNGDGDGKKDNGAGERLLGKGVAFWAVLVGLGVVGFAAVL